MNDWQQRTKLLLGEDRFQKLQNSKVLVAGLGGVGGYVVEQLVRAGLGEITIADSDTVQESNINRQIIALHSTLGKKKTDIIKSRAIDINPEVKINTVNDFLIGKNIELLLKEKFDFVVDAIDTLTPKIDFIYHAVQNKHLLVSSMGSGGKTNASLIQIADFKKTINCRLAFFLRKKLRKKGITGGFPVVFSTEQTDKDSVVETNGENNKKSIVGTISYIPAIFGCFCASVVIDGLTQ